MQSLVRFEDDVVEGKARHFWYRNVLLSLSLMCYYSALVKTCPKRNNFLSPSRQSLMQQLDEVKD
jgi:hypothetical protein